jgi:acetylornithine deacetylase
MAKDAIRILEKYHEELLNKSRGISLFDPYPNPMPITFGSLKAGNWPASAPNKAILQGVLGLLPNKTKEQVCEEMRLALIKETDTSFKENFELKFMYRHDSSVTEPDNKLPQTLCAAAENTGVSLKTDAMTASCDAWFYNNHLNIPTVVFGPGSLGVAHSENEQISMKEIGNAAEILVTFILNYCN